eukprot:1689673-Rhodomonas_salina.2
MHAELRERAALSPAFTTVNPCPPSLRVSNRARCSRCCPPLPPAVRPPSSHPPSCAHCEASVPLLLCLTSAPRSPLPPPLPPHPLPPSSSSAV